MHRLPHQFALLAVVPLRDDEGVLPMPGSLWQWSNWSWEISIVLPLAILFAWYGFGAIHRGRQPGIFRQHFAFVFGWILLALALVPPLHRLGDVLFSAHMLWHEVLLLLAASLFAASHPGVTLLYAFRQNMRQPVGATAVRIERLPIALQHLSFFLSGVLF